MSKFVEKLKNDGSFADAYLVAKNLLSKDISNIQLFQEYIDLALEFATYEITFDERKAYLEDSSSALTLFSETATIDEDCLILIKETKNRIIKSFQTVFDAEAAFLDEYQKEIIAQNTKLLGKLSDIYKELTLVDSQDEFDKILSSVSSIEEQLNKKVFTANQEQSYTTLTKGYSEAISAKMEELNKKSLLSYNKKAVKCFNDVLSAFKNDPSKYKNESNLKALMTTKFFAFDTSKMFNESLIFYNHVYSVVFQDATDKLKYKLTEWALNTQKIEK